MTLSGTDYMGTVALPAGAVISPGTVVFSLPVAIHHMTKTRLFRFAQLFEYWEVEEMKFNFTSSMAATATGSYAMMFDYDPLDYDPTLADMDMNDVFGHKIHIQNKVWENATLVVPRDPRAGKKELYTNCEGGETLEDQDRLSVFGTLTMVSCDSYQTTAEQLTLGQMFVSYKIKLYGPTLHQGLAGGAYYELSGATHQSNPVYTNADIVANNGDSGVVKKTLPVKSKINGAAWSAARRLAQKAFGDGGETVVNKAYSLATNAQLFLNAIDPIVKVASALFGSGENSVSLKNDFVTLEPGSYRWTVTFSNENSSGALITTPFNMSQTFQDVFLFPVVLQNAAYSHDGLTPYVSSYNSYRQGYIPSASTARDLVFYTEFTVIKKCDVGIAMAAANSAAAQVPFFGGAAVQYVRVTHYVDKLAAMSMGDWSVTSGTNNALKNAEPMDFQVCDVAGQEFYLPLNIDGGATECPPARAHLVECDSEDEEVDSQETEAMYQSSTIAKLPDALRAQCILALSKK